MGNETKKSFERRLKNGDFNRFFNGHGVDIGCGKDPVKENSIKHDKIFGKDALDLSEYEAQTFDYVYSSHCLEHIQDTQGALKEWWRVLKKGGHLIVVVPEWTLYEKRHFPSKFNTDHKRTFNVDTMLYLAHNLQGSQVIRLQINDEGFNYSDKTTDQTRKGAQAEIEIIIRKVEDDFWSDLNCRLTNP